MSKADLQTLIKDWLDSKKMHCRGPFDAVPGFACLETDVVHFCIYPTHVDAWAMQRPQVFAVRIHAADPEFFSKLESFR